LDPTLHRGNIGHVTDLFTLYIILKIQWIDRFLGFKIKAYFLFFGNNFSVMEFGPRV